MRYLKKIKLQKISREAFSKLKRMLLNYLNEEKKEDFFITPFNIRQLVKSDEFLNTLETLKT